MKAYLLFVAKLPLPGIASVLAKCGDNSKQRIITHSALAIPILPSAQDKVEVSSKRK